VSRQGNCQNLTFACAILATIACYEPLTREEIEFDEGLIESMIIEKNDSLCEVVAFLRPETTIGDIFDLEMFGPAGPPADLSFPNKTLGPPRDIRFGPYRTSYIYDAPGGELAIEVAVGDDGYTTHRELWLYPENKRLNEILSAEVVNKIPTFPGYCSYDFVDDLADDRLTVTATDSVAKGIMWKHMDNVPARPPPPPSAEGGSPDGRNAALTPDPVGTKAPNEGKATLIQVSVSVLSIVLLPVALGAVAFAFHRNMRAQLVSVIAGALFSSALTLIFDVFPRGGFGHHANTWQGYALIQFFPFLLVVATLAILQSPDRLKLSATPLVVGACVPLAYWAGTLIAVSISVTSGLATP